MTEKYRLSLKISGKRIVFLIAIFSLVVIFFGGPFLMKNVIPRSLSCSTFLPSLFKLEQDLCNKITYSGVPFDFRANVWKAGSVPVIPAESRINADFYTNEMKNITIVYSSNGKEDAILALETFEIVNKLALFYKLIPNGPVEVQFGSQEVSSFQNVTGEMFYPKVIIKSPSQSTATQVAIENHVVTIEGKSLKELDLAVVKFIIVILGLEV